MRFRPPLVAIVVTSRLGTGSVRALRVDHSSPSLEAALRFISEYPEGAPLVYGDSRGKTLSHFPYSVIYDIHRDRILVIAIADERREPGTYDSRFQ